MLNLDHSNNCPFDNQENANASVRQHWFNVKNVENKHEVSRQYLDICQRHQEHKKWILVINPENGSLAPLSGSESVDTSKILRVNVNKVKVQMCDIETALSKGNCSAVILCNATFEQAQISQLAACAMKGKTECIVIKNIETMQ